GLAHLALAAVDGGDVDDAAEAARAHALDDEPRHVESGVEVGAEHRVPILLLHAMQRGVAGDAGVVVEDVDGAAIPRDARHPFLAIAEVAAIELVDGDAGLGLELARRRIVARIVRCHPAALVLESDGNRLPDAARTAGDDGNPTHVRFLSIP